MKTRISSIAICVASSFYAPQGFSEPANGASTASQNTNPVDGISHIYSDIDMRMRMAGKPNAQACSGDSCITNATFDTQVQTIGARLSEAAYATYPDLKKRVPNFTFGVADKAVVGSASNASGTVILFRGVQYLDLSDEATAFILAREMGHVIGDHHKSNTKTKLLISVLAGILFPAVGILSASSAATQATTATSVLTSAASTATSILGSEVAMSRIKPTQLVEADDIALAILTNDHLNAAQIAQALEFIAENEKSTGWEKDLHESKRYVRQLAGEPQEEIAALEPLPEAPELEELASAPAEIKGTPEANTHAPSRADDLDKSHIILANASMQQTPQALPNPPAEAPRKSILITNETLAQSHAIAQPANKTKKVISPNKNQTLSKAKSKTQKAKKLASKKPSAKSKGLAKTKLKK